ncbi:uncharacterized protein TNCV_3829041 [Trichonephila clavipes]|nr:uncharacterized protein TNCV_3829041 [Trichonephila clavipes]
MATSGSSFIPTSLGHENNVEVGQHLLPYNGAQRDLISLRDLACAYLKGHLLGRAWDRFEIFGSALVQNTATDLEQLKAALTKNFPVVCNKKDVEIQFYSLQQRKGQETPDFIYDLLKIHKTLGLGISEEALVDHIFVRLEPQC